MPGEGNWTFPLAGHPQVRSAGKSGRGRGSTPHGPAAPSGLGKPGIHWCHMQRKEPHAGESQSPAASGNNRAGSSAGLCRYSRRCQEALLTPFPGQLSTFTPPCFRDRGCPAISSSKIGCQRTKPLCPTPYATRSGRICTAPLPNGPRENKSTKTFLAFWGN